MKNQQISLTLIIFNNYLNNLSHKAGMSKFSKGVQDLLNLSFTEATAIMAEGKQSEIAEGYSLSDYSFKTCEENSLSKLFNAAKTVYWNDTAREQGLRIARASRVVINKEDYIKGVEPSLLTPVEVESVYNTLTTGQFPMKLTPVSVDKKQDVYATSLTFICQEQMTVGKNTQIVKLLTGKGGKDEDAAQEGEVCLAMFYKLDEGIDLTAVLPETLDCSLAVMFNKYTGRTFDTVIQGFNPFAKATFEKKRDE